MMWTVQTLCEELALIQDALDADALDHLPQMVECYHLHLSAWIGAGAGRDVAALRQLRDLHWQILSQLQRRQQHLRTRMQADRHGGRAARAYLSSTPS